jgi:hypothetical protein
MQMAVLTHWVFFCRSNPRIARGADGTNNVVGQPILDSHNLQMVSQLEFRCSALQIYKDGNHKPEMAIAISDFEALCGFVGAPELAQVIINYPELLSCLNPAALEANGSTQQDQKRQLKLLFTSLMTCDDVKVILRPP